MEKYLEDQSISELMKASSKDPRQLRATVKNIEQQLIAKVRAESSDRDDEEILRPLWLRLVSFSVNEANVELAILMAAKLRQVQLALALTNTVRRDTPLSWSVARAYVANYFRIDSKRDSIAVSGRLSLAEFEYALEFFVTGLEWNKAFELIKRQFVGHESAPFARLIHYRRAQFEEAEEEFEKALIDYEAAEAQASDLVRLLMKQHLDASTDKLQHYCLAHENMRSFWEQFTYSHQSHSPVIPETIRLFIEDEEEQSDNRTNKWLDRKRVEFLKTVVSSSSNELVATLSRESTQARQTCDLKKALSIDLILNEMSSFTEQLPLCTPTMDCVSIYASLPDYSYFLANFLATNYYNGKRRHQPLSTTASNKLPENAYFMACIRLGLVNESLEELAMDRYVKEETLEQAIHYLEEGCCRQSDKTPADALDYLDPVLEGTTLTKLEPLLGDNPSLTTAVISIVILSATIYLIKLQQQSHHNNSSRLSELESMFQKLSTYLDEYDFIASDTFVRCTSRLMNVAGDQLDAISDSEIIRATLRRLVERGAGRSLMQARYRSAAKLYQLVDDNINAVKSLMRLGDVELVIRYSLLVRDVTVNRLTVNYLKHLNADLSTIEDFIAKSREAVSSAREAEKQ